MRQPVPQWHDFAQTPPGAPSGVVDLSITPAEHSPAIRIARLAWRALKLALEAGALVALVALFFVRVPQVAGRSMKPQLRSDEHVLIDTLAYDFRIGGRDQPLLDVRIHSIKRGDVIAFDHAIDGVHRIYVKRIVGLPGDNVAVTGGVVSINGVVQREAAGVERDHTTISPQRVAADAYFVLGDNRGESDDSREFGAVLRGAVIGRAALIVWPLNRAGPIK